MNTAIIQRLIDEFTSKKIPFILIGGLALHFHNYDRQTYDIDFLIDKNNFKAVVPFLEELGYSLENLQETFARFDGEKKDLMDFDLMFVDGETFKAVLRDAKQVDMGGQSILVPSLFHLIALKLHSIKGNPRQREFKDLLDIAELIRKNKIEVKSTIFQNILKKYGSQDIYEKIMRYFSEDQ